MPPITLEERVNYEVAHFDKKAVLAEIQTMQADYAKKYPGQENFFNPEVYTKLLDDPDRIRSYCQAKVLAMDLEERHEIGEDFKIRYLDHQNLKHPTAVDRAIYLYLDPSGTPEANEQNKNLLDMLHSPDRGMVVERVINDVSRLDIAELNAGLDGNDPDGSMQFAMEHMKEIKLGFLTKDIISPRRRGFQFNENFEKNTENCVTYAQSTGGFETFSDIMSSPLAFCFQTMQDIDLGTKTQQLVNLNNMYRTTDPVSDSVKKGCSAIIGVSQQYDEIKQYQQFFRDNPEFAHTGSPFSLMAVDENGNEINLNDAILNHQGTVQRRPPEDVPTVGHMGHPVSVDTELTTSAPEEAEVSYQKAKESHEKVLSMMQNEEGKPMRGDPTNYMIRSFRALANIHFARTKPRWWHFVFRTETGRAHAAERKLMNEYSRLLKDRGVSAELCDRISDRRNAGQHVTPEELEQERVNVERTQREKYGVDVDRLDHSQERMRPGFLADNRNFQQEMLPNVDDLQPVNAPEQNQPAPARENQVEEQRQEQVEQPVLNGENAI